MSILRCCERRQLSPVVLLTSAIVSILMALHNFALKNPLHFTPVLPMLHPQDMLRRRIPRHFSSMIISTTPHSAASVSPTGTVSPILFKFGKGISEHLTVVEIRKFLRIRQQILHFRSTFATFRPFFN